MIVVVVVVAMLVTIVKVMVVAMTIVIVKTVVGADARVDENFVLRSMESNKHKH